MQAVFPAQQSKPHFLLNNVSRISCSSIYTDWFSALFNYLLLYWCTQKRQYLNGSPFHQSWHRLIKLWPSITTVRCKTTRHDDSRKTVLTGWLAQDDVEKMTRSRRCWQDDSRKTVLAGWLAQDGVDRTTRARRCCHDDPRKTVLTRWLAQVDVHKMTRARLCWQDDSRKTVLTGWLTQNGVDTGLAQDDFYKTRTSIIFLIISLNIWNFSHVYTMFDAKCFI